MFETPQIMSLAQASARHAATRQTAVSRNIANADTPGYQAQDVQSFAALYHDQADGFTLRQTRPGHLADPRSPADPRLGDREDPDTVEPNGNTVSLEQELVRAADVKRQHDLALSIYRSAQGILRSTLGRNA